MQVRTTVKIDGAPESIWPLLTNSRMDVPGCFCLGLPQPKSCELPSQQGGVGAERRCISDRGVVTQRITEWEPSSKLAFEMVETDHSWAPSVKFLKDEFTIDTTAKGAKVTRITTIKAKGVLAIIRELGFYLGLKRVHLFVFKNWKAEAEG